MRLLCRSCPQWVSIRYTEHLAGAGITTSVGSRVDSYDNALAETVDGLYKAELIHAWLAWSSVTEVEFATMSWVHWWNYQRPHQARGYSTPAEIETAYARTRAPAPGPV